ncbi:MAG TPA: hypothetical protein VG406_22260 [Isosphaeraceae bacterium]|jgi:hypothetical protein|nr:hypothetical protein [Isosphaeraceae bacterium]
MGSFRPRLLEATTAGDRMDALCEFLEFWLGPRQDDFGEPIEELDRRPLPMPLRRLYGFAGRWPRRDGRTPLAFAVPVLSHQDDLLLLDELTTADDGKLIFLHENQGVWSCRTLPKGDDPPVWCCDHVDEAGKRSTRERLVCDSLSRFLATFVLEELTFGSRLCLLDDGLTDRFRSESAAAIPVWQDAPYVDRNDWNFFLWGDVLVFDHVVGVFMAANHPAGIAFLEANQWPMDRIRIFLFFRWDLEVEADGSARLVQRDAVAREQAVAPAGTFDFAGLREALDARATRDAHFEEDPMVTFHRRGQPGGVEARYLHDPSFVDDLLRRTLVAASPPNPALLRLLTKERPV